MATRFHSATARVNGKTCGSALPCATGLSIAPGRALPQLHRAFHVELLNWYHANKRDLPWRRTHDPYKIWVSEIMLQQTRVDVVRDYYARWLRAFPTLQSLARAPYARVLKLWEGLGYYSRARNLHRAAKLVVGRARSTRRAMPTTAVEWQMLPGVGR